jgi:phosphohistidine swiveling domain-containing protein
MGMNMIEIITPNSRDISRNNIGGKAEQLFKLSLIGHNVPKWIVIPTEVLELVSKNLGIEGYLVTDGSECDYKYISSTIRNLILNAEISADISNLIRKSISENFSCSEFVAVRSSAVGEDSETESYAGIHESFLFLKGELSIIEGIKKVWASAYSERALQYRHSLSLSFTDIKIAVIIQEMVDSVSSGVVFTANPINSDIEEVVVNALFGLGEGIVSEGLDADSWLYDKESKVLSTQVADKLEKIVFDVDAGQGTIKVDLAENEKGVLSLREDQVQTLIAASLSIEAAYGSPQDIEFAFDKCGKLYILQTRAITTLDEYGPAAGNSLLWDNSNIIESYSGVTSPLTFSFIKRAYTIVYHCFAEVMGISPSVVQKNEQVFSNMLGLFRGQVYYNLLNWYRLVQLFPGFSYTSKFMESMMGVSESIKLDGALKSIDRKSKLRGFFDLIILLMSSGWKFLNIKSISNSFQLHFSKNYSLWSKLNFKTLRPYQLMNIYYEMEEKLLWNWKAPIINDFYVMVFYGLLKKLCGLWCKDEQGTLQNDLLSGEGGIESTEPTKMLIRLASMARSNPKLTNLIKEEAPTSLSPMILDREEFSEFKELYLEYLEKYGFRCMNELKLEEFSLRDKPERVFEHLKNYLNVPLESLDLDLMHKREQSVRQVAEEKVKIMLSNLSLPFVRQKIFNRVLSSARLGVKNRENMRFARTKIYGLLRELFRAVGENFEREGIVDDKQDVFYLSVEEIWDFVRGTAITTDLRALITLRKNEFSSFKAEEERFPESRFKTYGIAYHKNNFRTRLKAASLPSDGGLSGTGCCPGVIRGRTKVIKDPSDGISLSGEILVAGRTDPGWVPLYPAAIGILIERGSILSHSAIVAREMGIPTIVGIPGLLSALKSGDEIEMDGSSGKVLLLNSEKV